MSKSGGTRLILYSRKDQPIQWVSLNIIMADVSSYAFISHTYLIFVRVVSCCVAGLDFMDNTGVDYENALINAGFGKFHYYLLAICGMIYLNTAVGITIISFVLPSATCDFQMTSEDKGWLTAAPMLGNIVCSF